jgi:hypothetical protein
MLGHRSGYLLTHPTFTDIYMELLTKFYIKETDRWSIRVRWWHKRGRVLAEQRLKISPSKLREFIIYKREDSK